MFPGLDQIYLLDEPEESVSVSAGVFGAGTGSVFESSVVDESAEK